LSIYSMFKNPTKPGIPQQCHYLKLLKINSFQSEQ
jgi:hypothetical protein